jgi:long-chain fatty acid transport protein
MDMKNTIAGAGIALLLTTTSALAVGLDRSFQDIDAIFETGNYANLTFGFTQPDLTGTDILGNPISNVGQDFSVTALGLKMDINEQFSFGIIIDQPYGVDVTYGGDPATTMLGGTAASLDSTALNAILRYKFNDNYSVHGGIRYQTLSADVTLSGLSYSLLSGYNVKLEDGSGTGYILGAAYERPEIALRVALTYFSEIENEFDTVESLGGAEVLAATTTVNSPEAVNLDFQTGVAANTLVFGQIRYAAYSQTILSPDFFASVTGGASITDLSDGTGYTLGVGHRFTDTFTGIASIGWEPEDSDDLVSPLSPTNGYLSLSLGGQYTIDALTFTGGIRYTMLGDANPEVGTPDTQVATFEGNSAVSVGLGVAYRF